METNVENLVGRRFLVKMSSKSKIEEIMFLEVSPSRKYVKVKVGSEVFWLSISKLKSIKKVEELRNINTLGIRNWVNELLDKGEPLWRE